MYAPQHFRGTSSPFFVQRSSCFSRTCMSPFSLVYVVWNEVATWEDAEACPSLAPAYVRLEFQSISTRGEVVSSTDAISFGGTGK